MSTTQVATGRQVAYKPGMEPEVVSRATSAQAASEARSDAYRAALPSVYRHLTVADLPERQTNGIVGWLNGSGTLLWLGGGSWKGKTASGWLLAIRWAVETGHSWSFTTAEAYLAARRGIQTPEEAALIAKAHRADLLVLDEWPRTLNGGKDLDYLRDLMEQRKGRRTVITANGRPGLSPDLLAHPDQATAMAAQALHNRMVDKHADGTRGPAFFAGFPASLPTLPAPR